MPPTEEQGPQINIEQSSEDISDRKEEPIVAEAGHLRAQRGSPAAAGGLTSSLSKSNNSGLNSTSAYDETSDTSAILSNSVFLTDEQVKKQVEEERAKNERIKMENQLLETFLFEYADQNVIEDMLNEVARLEREAHRRKVFAKLKYVVGEKLGLRRAANASTRSYNKMKRPREPENELKTLTTWEKIEVCLIALNEERIHMRKEDARLSNEYVQAISRLDEIEAEEQELQTNREILDRLKAKAYNPANDTYCGEKVVTYFEQVSKKKTANHQRQILLTSQLTGDLRLNIQKQNLRNKRITNALDERASSGVGSESTESSDKVQQWQIDRESMELVKKKQLLEQLNKQSSEVGLQLTCINQQHKKALDQITAAKKEKQQILSKIQRKKKQIIDVGRRSDNAVGYSAVEEKRNTRIFNSLTEFRPRLSSPHEQIILNAQVHELRRQVKTWQRRVEIAHLELAEARKQQKLMRNFFRNSV